MNPLAIALLLAIKHGVFILWSHLRLRGHLVLPALQLDGGGEAVLLEGAVDGRDDGVDEAEAFALAALLGRGETPGDFPAKGGGGGGSGS